MKQEIETPIYMSKSPCLKPDEYYIDYEYKKIKICHHYNNFYDIFWTDFIETQYKCNICQTLYLKCIGCKSHVINCYKCIETKNSNNKYHLLYCSSCI